MEMLIVNGGNRLNGKVRIPGAKNAVLPILAASTLTDEEIILKDCPALRDVQNMLSILNQMGCTTEFSEGNIRINSSGINSYEMPDMLAKELRSSIFMVGPVLGRLRKAIATYPGGCEIGLRPIDLHLKGLRALNVKIDESKGYILCDGSEMKGGIVHLDYPSVGATENVLMAAVLIPGVTTIHNAAKEPEIVDLEKFVNKMGAKVFGAGTDSIVIEGVEKLHGIEYTLMPDRIVAGTYMLAPLACGGEIALENVEEKHVLMTLLKIQEMGAEIWRDGELLRVKMAKRPKAISLTETSPYPGFPTDMQAQLLSILSMAEGTSMLVENIFENRFKHVPELIRMGAHILVKDRTAIIHGVPFLEGAKVFAKDLRGGAALILAALGAREHTTIEGVHYIDRGYDKIEKVLQGLGAQIQRRQENDITGKKEINHDLLPSSASCSANSR